MISFLEDCTGKNWFNFEYFWRKNELIFWCICSFFTIFFCSSISFGEVITKLPSKEAVIALTFDACETKNQSVFDKKILDYLVSEEIPFTIFVSGKFAWRNSSELAQLSKNYFIEIENHSLNHLQHMEKLNEVNVRKEVVECEKIITNITGRKPVFFRFPAGNFDERTLKIIEDLGYQVVHWRFPSGDPDKRITSERLSKWVLGMVKKGDILIFHINGRGYNTGEALPRIVQQLRQKGYRFTRLDEILSSPENSPR